VIVVVPARRAVDDGSWRRRLAIISSDYRATTIQNRVRRRRRKDANSGAAGARHIPRESVCHPFVQATMICLLVGFVPRDMSTGSAEAPGAVPMLKPSSVILDL
jgi:hypothetical protein